MQYGRSIFVTISALLFWLLAGNVLFAQNAWETLPVFHNGRVMPLHTFAQQAVREICGTPNPYIIRDDTVIAEFNQVLAVLRNQEDRQDGDGNDLDTGSNAKQYRFLIRGSDLDGGLDRSYSEFDIEKEAQQVSTTLPIQGLPLVRAQRLSDRIRQLVPPEGRYFTADEIVMSWICEPEVWRYIPIFLVKETDYLDEMLGISFKNDVRTSQYRVSLHQLERSQRYKQRCADIRRRQQLAQTAQNPVRYDQITERLESQSQIFQQLTFHPQQAMPTRMFSLLQQAVGSVDEQSSYTSSFDAWELLLSLGEVPERQSTERTLSTDEFAKIVHPTTKRWHDIADTIHLLIRNYSRKDNDDNPILPNSAIAEQIFEILVKTTDENLEEAEALMEMVYPGLTYRSDSKKQINVERLLPKLWQQENQQQNRTVIRRVVVSYYYSVKKLRNEIEAAYLALYDNGRSLRFLPLRSPYVLSLGIAQENFNVQPWASAQMVLGSGEAFVRRFLDPQFDAPIILPKEEKPVEELDPLIVLSRAMSPGNESESEEETEKEDSQPEPEQIPAEELLDPVKQLERKLFAMQDTDDGILYSGSGSANGMIGAIRNDLRTLLFTFSTLGGEYGSSDFSIRTLQLEQTIRQAAIRIESFRESLIDKENPQLVELITKTAYPAPGALQAEYRYDRLNPSFWMGVFAFLAVLLTAGAYAAGLFHREDTVSATLAIHSAVRDGKEIENRIPDYTNTPEEYLFAGSVVMLIFAIFVTFAGGMMRAMITGWAPVTNMYETIVLMAFSTAIFGIWYALYPLVHPALLQAWFYTKFPRIHTAREWLIAVKTRKMEILSRETDGEAAMREAAAEFGVPGGLTFGGHLAPTSAQSNVEIENQRHIQIAARKITAQCLLAIPRLVLAFLTFYMIVSLANGDDLAAHGFFTAATNTFAANDTIDALVTVASIFLMVWLIPHLILTLLTIPVILFRPSWIAAELGIRSFESKVVAELQPPATDTAMKPRSELGGVFMGETGGLQEGVRDNSGTAWLKLARNECLNRKLFIVITACIVFFVGIAAIWNRAEFNPDIRPIAAVLRSNFWLTVHVIAIVVSYASAFVAWGMAVVAIGFIVFGKYKHTAAEFEEQRPRVQLPELCQTFLPIIDHLLKAALLLLIIGTVLGARWADYSWGRFWSWDPKEVWALITILFYVMVFHGRIARYYGTIGIFVGALFASIAVIITWYGINFVFKGSVHSYGGGSADNATLFLGLFIAMNFLWGSLALLRYGAEVYGRETDD